MKDFLQPAYTFGIPPQTFWERFCCRQEEKMIKMPCRTFHWGILWQKDCDGWTCFESLGPKGVAPTRFDYPFAYIYRVKKLASYVTPYDVGSVISHYGECLYDNQVNVRMGIWLLAHTYLHIDLPIKRNGKYNCVELVNAAVMDLVLKLNGIQVSLVPPNTYPYPVLLEHSPELEFIGEYKI